MRRFLRPGITKPHPTRWGFSLYTLPIPRSMHFPMFIYFLLFSCISPQKVSPCNTNAIPGNTMMINARYFPVYNRKGKLTEKGTGLIQVQVYLRKKQRFFSTGLFVKPAQWDPSAWVIKHSQADSYNAKIRSLISELEQYEIRAKAKGDRFTLDMLPTGKKSRLNFLTYMDEGIDQDNLAKGTRKQHYATLNHLMKFGKIVEFSDITNSSIMAFDAYLHENSLQQSSIYGQHKRVTKWIRKALREGYVQRNPYDQLTFSSGNRNTIKYLSPEQLVKIESKVFQIERLNIVRDVFLFACYTGLAYQKLQSLKRDQISHDDDGTVWIIGNRKKVSEAKGGTASGEYFVPLHQKALDILKKYEGVRDPYLLPVHSNQRFNSYLKEIQVLCEIDMNLTSHVARHSFATIFINRGVSLESIRKMLGHSSISMTQKYSKVLKDRVKEEMKKVF